MKNQRFTNALLIMLLVLSSQGKAATGWNSFIINFDKSDYGKGSQTWQIAPYNDNWIYFANKNGLVQFDGNVWNVYPMNNRSDMRSLLVSAGQKRIYAGGINEFGFYEPDETGALVYRCLSDTLADNIHYLGNVWGIHEAEDALYFQGDNRVVRYENGKYTAIEMDGKIDCSNMIDDVLYIGTDRGVWVLQGSRFVPLQGAEELGTLRIRDIVPYKNGVLVVTAYNGLYYCDGMMCKQFHTGAEEYMRRNEVFCAAKRGNRIALGTVQKGIVLIDLATKEVKYFNENNGLRNNTVLSVAFDTGGNLWAGLNNGIGYVCLSSPFTNLYSYPYSFGTGYAAALEGNCLYLGTNRGLFYTPYPVDMSGNVPDIRPIPNSGGQVWDLCRVNEELFCLHDRGIFKVVGTELQRITDITGAWACQAVTGRTNLMYVGVYSGLYLVEKRDGVWQTVCKIKGISDSCRLFEQESANVIWIYEADRVIRLELNNELTEAVGIKDFGKAEGFFVGRDVRIAKIGGRVCFSTPQGMYEYNPQQDVMIPCPDTDRLMNEISVQSRLLEYRDRLISLNPNEIRMTNLGTYKQTGTTGIYPIKKSLIEFVPEFETLVPLSDSTMIVPNEDGFALFTIPSTNEVEDRSRILYIRSMSLSYPKDQLIYAANFLGYKPAPTIPYSSNSVRFEYALSFRAAGDDARFQYRLNKEEWSDLTTVKTKEYSNLKEGEYTFEVKAVLTDGSISTDSITFSILPPWYRSTAAYIIYTLLTLVAAWYLYRWDNRRVKRKKEQAIHEKDEEMHAMEQEYQKEKARREKQIMQLEKEQLEHDLQHKSQEMANLMINFARKNEILTEIKSDILKVTSQMKGETTREEKQKLMLINNKIDSNMQSDDVLKRIEEQFDLIHNNFMKRLRAKHPDLSNNECMMCAYLKMNLSTKEIAPLLNISVRGVETIRYRLRKKFGLEREDGLADYLDNQL